MPRQGRGRNSAAHRSSQRFYGGLITRKRGYGQFLQTCQAKTLQEFCGCGEAQTAVPTGEFLQPQNRFAGAPGFENLYVESLSRTKPNEIKL